MHMMKVFLGMSLLGIVGITAVCYTSPTVFMKISYALVRLNFDHLPEFSSQSLRTLHEAAPSDYVIVDVRTPQERNVSMIAGAIDQTFFEQNMTDYHEKKIIVYCTIGYRSGYYAQTLRNEGFDAYNLREGILGWAYANGSLLTPRGEPTRRVHVYSQPWDLALKNHIAVF